MTVRLNDHGLDLEGRRLPLISGSIHYWRHLAKDWPQLLERVKSLGFDIICTYIPWGVHEAGPGTFDFGELDPSKDVGRFLDLAAQAGLLAIVRPGPHINAELPYFGFPARVIENPNCLARNARGGFVILPIPPRAFPVISYASDEFWRELEGWFGALAPLLRPRLYPGGPVVGVQLDNEMSYFFRTSAYDQDYHPDARAKWLAFLKTKYGDLHKAADIYNSRQLPDETPLPDDFRAQTPQEILFYLDWVEFKEELLIGSFALMREMWRRHQVDGVVFSHNFPPAQVKSPLNIPRAERHVDYCGVDFYLHRYEYPALKRRLLMLGGQSRFPVSPEFASGCYLWWPPVDLADQEFTAKAAWMYGLKGINFYMLVERDSWYGSPITRTGAVRRDYWNFFERHLALLKKLQPWRLQRVAPVCLLSVREYERLEAATTAVSPFPQMAVDATVPSEDLCYEGNFGFARPIQYQHAKMLRGWEAALTRLGIPYVIGSSDLPVSRLADFQAVVCPTFEFMARQTQQTLVDYATRGGTLICGPEVPSLDECMWEHSTIGGYTGRPEEKLNCAVDVIACRAGLGRIVLIADVPLPPENALPIVTEVCRYAALEPVYPAAPPCETSLHRGPDGRRILYVINPTDEPRRAVIQLKAGRESFADLESGARFFGEDVVEIELPPAGVRILEVLG